MMVKASRPTSRDGHDTILRSTIFPQSSNGELEMLDDGNENENEDENEDDTHLYA